MRIPPITRSLAALLFLAAGSGTAQQRELFTATLTGSDAFPPVTTSALGSVALSFRDGSVEFKLEVGNINEVTSACIHLESPRPATVMLYTGPQTGLFSGVLASGTLGVKELAGLTFSELRHAIHMGKAFVSVHTVKHPGGEIQGRLAPAGMPAHGET